MRRKKTKLRMEWCWYTNNNGERKRLNVRNIEADDYEQIYRGRLTCIEGCEARIKFTQRKNGNKFLSTWNKEGNKHIEGICPYHVDYKGAIGRKRLEEMQEKVQISDERIQESLKRKVKNYLLEFSEDDIPKEKLSTNNIINNGTGNEYVKVDGGKSIDGVGDKKFRIRYMQAETINSSYENLYKGVIGIADNIQIGDLSKGEEWHYINLKNEYNRTSVYFPTAYYEGNKDRFNELEKVLKILKDKLEKDIDKKVIIACYGKIKLKKGAENDYNINIINPKHIIINGMSMNKIFIEGKIDDLSIE